MPRRSSEIIPDTERISHHATGTNDFIAIDGEGINTTESLFNDSAFCINCPADLSYKTRYRRNGNGPLCRTCYYTKADMNV